MIEFEPNFLLEERNRHALEVKKAYQLILEKIMLLISTIENKDLHNHIVIENANGYAHQFFSPIIHLRLSEDYRWIGFAKDLELKPFLGTTDFHKIYRIIINATSKEQTEVDIEDCLDEFEYWYEDYEEAKRTLTGG